MVAEVVAAVVAAAVAACAALQRGIHMNASQIDTFLMTTALQVWESPPQRRILMVG